MDDDTPAEEVADLRRKLAWKAFQHCASYDSQVAEWMWGQVGGGEPAPERSVPMQLAQGLRYGENPHQSAAFYTDFSLGEVGMGGVARAVQHHGKEMSYNNYLDTDAAYNAVVDFEEPACVIVKHTNPCGAAVKDDLLEAYRLAVIADPISAFGGIVAFNRPVDEVRPPPRPEKERTGTRTALCPYPLCVTGMPLVPPCSPLRFYTNFPINRPLRAAETSAYTPPAGTARPRCERFRAICHSAKLPAPLATLQALANEIREFRSPTDGETRMFYEIVVAPGYTEKVRRLPLPRVCCPLLFRTPHSVILPLSSPTLT